MTIVVSYRVDKERYHAAEAPHKFLVIVTVYLYENEILIHLNRDRDSTIRLNEGLAELFSVSGCIPQEQFLIGIPDDQGNGSIIPRSIFEEKLKRFDLSQTVIDREIVEDYSYEDKTGKPDKVTITIKDTAAGVTATIDFRNLEHRRNFPCPDWLIPLE